LAASQTIQEGHARVFLQTGLCRFVAPATRPGGYGDAARRRERTTRRRNECLEGHPTDEELSAWAGTVQAHLPAQERRQFTAAVGAKVRSCLGEFRSLVSSSASHRNSLETSQLENRCL